MTEVSAVPQTDGLDLTVREAPASGTDWRPTVSIKTHGCKLNQADSDLLARQFILAGYRIVSSAADADVFVLNTCTVTANADAKARQALRAAKKANPQTIVVATGCYAQWSGQQLSKIEGVALVVGNTGKERLSSMVTDLLEKGQSPAVHTHSNIEKPDPSDLTTPTLPSPASFRHSRGQFSHSPNQFSHSDGQFSHSDGQFSHSREGGNPQPTTGAVNLPVVSGRNRAMVKIQEGCDQVCAYCIVPKVRGRERSIPPETLVSQINERVDEGFREVVLTGTQLGTYGFDLSDITLTRLLRRILAETGVSRLRVSSLQAHEIDPPLLELWQDSRMCPHFHIPLQSGSDAVLGRMRRRYTTGRFAETIALVRDSVPGCSVTTDLIVGFPGEGDVEYHESLAFAQAMDFADMHIFPYSSRPGTTAAYFVDDLSPSEKKSRVARMMEMAEEGFRAFRTRQLGQTRPVLWESKRVDDGGMTWRGLTDNYIRVYGKTNQDLSNSISLARLVELDQREVAVQAI